MAQRGLLVGMVTIKDLLKHVAKEEHDELTREAAALPTIDDTGAEFGIGTGELERTLDAVYGWGVAQAARVPWPAFLRGPRASDHVPLTTIYEQEEAHP